MRLIPAGGALVHARRPRHVSLILGVVSIVTTNGTRAGPWTGLCDNRRTDVDPGFPFCSGIVQ